MEEGREGIKIAVALVIVLLIATVAFAVLSQGKRTSNQALAQVDDLNNTMNDAKYTDYEGQTITGNQVQSLIKQFNGDTVFVKTIDKSSHTTWYNYSNQSLSSKVDQTTNNTRVGNCSAKGNAEYIEPSAQFLCTITRNSSNTIMGLTFTQQ